MTQPKSAPTKAKKGSVKLFLLKAIFWLSFLTIPMLASFLLLSARVAPWWSQWLEIAGEKAGLVSGLIGLGFLLFLLPLIFGLVWRKKSKKKTRWWTWPSMVNILLLVALYFSGLATTDHLNTHGSWLWTQFLGPEHPAVGFLTKQVGWKAGEDQAAGTEPSPEITNGAVLEATKAIAANELDALEELLRKNPELKKYYRDPKINYLISEALDLGNRDALVFLKKKGFPFSAGPKGGPLHWALRHDGIGQNCKLLVDQGADPTARDSMGNTPLHYLVIHNNYHLATGDFLMLHGADINAQNDKGDTPLHSSILHGNSAGTGNLLARGADPEVKNKDGETALELTNRLLETASDYKINSLYLRGKQYQLENAAEVKRRNIPEWEPIFKDDRGDWEVDVNSGRRQGKDGSQILFRSRIIGKADSDVFLWFEDGRLRQFQDRYIEDPKALKTISKLAAELPEKNIFVVEIPDLPENWSEEKWNRELNYRPQVDSSASSPKNKLSPSPQATPTPESPSPEPSSSSTPDDTPERNSEPEVTKLSAHPKADGKSHMDVLSFRSREIFCSYRQNNLKGQSFTLTLKHQWYPEISLERESTATQERNLVAFSTPNNGWIPGPYELRLKGPGDQELSQSIWVTNTHTQKRHIWGRITDLQWVKPKLTPEDKELEAQVQFMGLVPGAVNYEIFPKRAANMALQKVVAQGSVTFQNSDEIISFDLGQGLNPGYYEMNLRVSDARLKTVYFTVAGQDEEHKLSETEAAFFEAIELENGKAAGLLAQNPALAKSRNAKGLSPLHRACTRGKLELVKQLVALGADVNEKELYFPRKAGHSGTTPLFDALTFSNTEIVKFLIESGAEVNAKNFAGQTPLFEAARAGDLESAKLLIEKGAKVDIQLPRVGFPDQPAPNILYYCPGKAEWLSLMIKNGASPKTSSKREWTALHHHAKSPEAVKLLIESGTPVDLRDPVYGKTPLHLASSAGQLESVKLLLESGADINAQDFSGKTPLARASSHPEVYDFLLEKGANPKIPDISGTLAKKKEPKDEKAP